MPLNLYPICWRGLTDCEPVHCIDAAPAGLDEQDYMEFNYTPESFVCSGVSLNPELPQDQYRLCFKNSVCDDMSDNDLQDLTSIMSVISAALNLDAVRKAASGIVEIPAAQAAQSSVIE